MELIETFFKDNLGVLQGNAKRKPRRVAASRELGELHGVRLAPSFARLVDLLGEIDNDKTYGTMARLGSLLARLVRSAGAGAIATLADLGSLSFLVAVVGVSPRGASVPALVVGAVVMFFGQKYLAFRARRGDTKRVVVLFALVQIGGLALSAILYDLVMRASPAAARHYVAARMVTTNVVWFAYSFPLWHLVFKPKADPPSPG